VAARNGGVEALVALCASAGVTQKRLLASGLKALSSLIRGMLPAAVLVNIHGYKYAELIFHSENG
jgi:hypothetical protein